MPRITVAVPLTLSRPPPSSPAELPVKVLPLTLADRRVVEAAAASWRSCR